MQETDSVVRPAARRPVSARAQRGKALVLGAELGIDDVAGLKRQLGQVLEQPARVVLDAAEVRRIHTAALQLFCLFCRDRRAEGREVEFARPSPAMLSAATLLGASTLLQLARAPA